jgi:EKC/KEOPS complex subunit CGI121/TPRKB
MYSQIAESFRRFGVQDTTTSLIAIKIIPNVPAGSAEEQSEIARIALHLQTHVQGGPTSFTDETLAEVSDVDRIRKMYKAPLPQIPKGSKGVVSNGVASQAAQKLDLEAILIGSMAIKGS